MKNAALKREMVGDKHEQRNEPPKKEKRGKNDVGRTPCSLYVGRESIDWLAFFRHKWIWPRANFGWGRFGRALFFLLDGSEKSVWRRESAEITLKEKRASEIRKDKRDWREKQRKEKEHSVWRDDREFSTVLAEERWRTVRYSEESWGTLTNIHTTTYCQRYTKIVPLNHTAYSTTLTQ